MKIGLYKLQCPKAYPQGWFCIIDTSIQMGPQKCVVVLALKKRDIIPNFCPTFEDLDCLIVRPLTSCPGNVVNEILEEATTIAGCSPLATISDQGAEFKKGNALFAQNHPETSILFDISHRINTCLKNKLENDRIWIAFKQEATSLIQNLKLSSIAHLVPPRQRSKARMHSAFPLIEWGLDMLQFLDSEKAKTLTIEEKNKLKWLEGYRFSLPFYIKLEEICKNALELVHQHGYYRNIEKDFIEKTKFLYQDDGIVSFRNEIGEILQEEGQKVPEGAHYPGSSEIIESVFGKFKALEDHHSSSGLTSLVLAIPALLGKLNETVLATALKNISVANVQQWIQENMGTTFHAKRRSDLARGKTIEEGLTSQVDELFSFPGQEGQRQKIWKLSPL